MPDLAQIKGYALSNDDIQEILEPDTKIITYPQFGTMNHIDEAFDALGRCIFLFLTTGPTTGHWLTMFKRKEGIEYFDSYGERPEEQRKWVEPDMLEELGEGEPYLMNLLRSSGYRVYSSTVPYQSDRSDVATCGRWAVARLICKDFSNKQFYDLVREQMRAQDLKSPDDWVALFTYEQLGK
jgi:hypothetical protein